MERWCHHHKPAKRRLSTQTRGLNKGGFIQRSIQEVKDKLFCRDGRTRVDRKQMMLKQSWTVWDFFCRHGEEAAVLRQDQTSRTTRRMRQSSWSHHHSHSEAWRGQHHGPAGTGKLGKGRMEKFWLQLRVFVWVKDCWTQMFPICPKTPGAWSWRMDNTFSN